MSIMCYRELLSSPKNDFTSNRNDHGMHHMSTLAPYINICSKTCLKWPLKKDKIKVLMENVSLMKVESIAECSHSAILLTCIKQ